MFEHDFFNENENGQKPARHVRAVGGIGWWLLHLVKAAFLLYSGYHGISASWNYAGNNDLARTAQIVGISVIEMTLAGLYLAWLNHRITGTSQSYAAGAAYAAGFILACLGIVADSQIHAGIALSPTMELYLRWGLPVAPALMVAGAVLVHLLEPEQMRRRDEAQQQNDLVEMRFRGRVAAARAEMESEQTVANMQLNARMAVARQIMDWYRSDSAQQAISDTARSTLPGLLRAIGVNADALPADAESLTLRARLAADPANAAATAMAASGQPAPTMRQQPDAQDASPNA